VLQGLASRSFAYRRLIAVFRVLSSSVLRSCNHEFAFRHHLAVQPRVRVLPSSSSVFPERVKVLQPRSRVSPSLAAFQTTSSHLRAAFQGD